MRVFEFNRRFMRLEQMLSLFPEACAADPGWWDAVRHDVMKLVYGRLTSTGAETPAPVSLPERLRHFAQRKLLRIGLEGRLWLGRHDVLVFRAPRMSRDGRRIDIALDQVLATCPGRKLVINTFPHRYDRGYARPGQLAPRPTSLGGLESAIQDEFGLAIDLDEVVRQRLADFEIGLRRYRDILARVRPRLVLINQNGIEKALFRAARLEGVPCVEVQHGLINGAHPAYAYPPDVNGEGSGMFPDVLFAFSQFWIDGCHYPARHRIPVGNDMFHPTALPTPPVEGEVLVISAAKYHADLARWLRLAAPRLPARRFVYKLHPGQAASFEVIRQELADLPNVAVRSTDVAMQALLAQARDVVLIQSTVAYEAVQAGRRLLIIPEQDYDTHTDLLPLDGVEVVADADALVTALERPAAPTVGSVFFAPFDAKISASVLDQLMNHGTLPEEDALAARAPVGEGLAR